jgi:hypothetical protein
MPTTNYSLPTLLGTNAFDLVTDYNALANATDAALAQVAGTIPEETITEMQGQISALQTLTGSQGSQITALQSQMTTANSNITTLQSGLQTANNSIGTLQTGLQTANSNINALNNSFQLTSVTYKATEIHSTASSHSVLTVLKNTENTIVNIYGRVVFSSAVTPVAIPGITGYYGTKTKVTLGTLENAYLFDSSGCLYFYSETETRYLSQNPLTALALGTDGYVYLICATTNEQIAADTRVAIYNSVKFLGTPVNYVTGSE